MIQQVHRGNPEQKQYVLVNDFSGGINTSDVDERMASNEFRALLNVELSTRGLLQNRKGWGLDTNYPELTELATQNIALVRKLDDTRTLIIAGTNNTTDTRQWVVVSTPPATFQYDFYYSMGLNNWTTTDAQRIAILTLNKGPATNYLPEVIFQYREHYTDDRGDAPVEVINTYYYRVDGAVSELNVYILKVSPTGSTLKLIYKTSGGYDGRYITGPDVAQYTNSVIIPLNQLNNRNGLLIINTETEQVSLVDGTDDTGYLPNPYEVKNIGFNVLRENPLDVGGLQSSITSIYGVYLTELDGGPVLKIPESGSFLLNVIYTGITDWVDWTKEFYTEDAQGNKTVVSATVNLLSTSGNTAVFKVTLNTANISSVFVSIRKSGEIAYDRAFSSTDALTAYFNPDETRFAVKVSGGYKIYERTSNYVYALSTTYTGVLPEFHLGQTIDLAGTDDYFYEPVNEIIFEKGTTGYAPFVSAVDAPQLESIYDIIPNASDVYKVGSTYYYYNGGPLGTSTDFSEISPAPTATVDYEYIDEFEIGNEDSQPVESLFTGDVSDLRLLTMGDRLVVYFGNTIWWSDFGNFSYFPSYNFVSLALDTGDSIQSINYFRGTWIVFTKQRIYRISGQFGESEFAVVLVNDAIGCISARSVRSFNNTLAWLSNDGFYVLKQNYYLGGLENVEKIDKHINGLYELATDVESVMYNEQVWWIFKNDDDFDVLKGYYNQKAPNGVPFVTDKYAVDPTNISIIGNKLYSIRAGVFYKFDEGYTDFGTAYTWRVKTTNLMFGYPTHEKKFKNIYIKTKSYGIVPIQFTINIDDVERVAPYQWVVKLDEDGVLTYEQEPNASYVLGSTLGIASASTYDKNSSVNEDGDIIMVDGTENDTVSDVGFQVGTNTLGEPVPQQHKLSMTLKGNTFQIMMEQSSANFISIQDIGFLYKLGKVRATTF